VLEVPLDVQQADHWCWAAVASGVAGYFHQYLRAASQCEVATRLTNRTVLCCVEPTPAACLFSASLEAAFRAVGLVNARTVLPLPFGTLADQVIAREYPVGIRLVGPGVAGHFVLVVGCDDVTGDVVVADPSGTGNLPAWRGWMTYEKLLTDYAGWHGVCTNAVLIG
jgi:hypothetical protein